jgi:hypothetical protein
MVAIGIATVNAEREVAQAEAPELEKVNWWSDPGLRKLYFWAAVLCVASATTGYDGYTPQPPTLREIEVLIPECSMMLNTSQNLDAWQAYFHNPDGGKLGLMNAIYQIGSLCSFPFV